MSGPTHHVLVTGITAVSGVLTAAFVGPGAHARGPAPCRGADVVPLHTRQMPRARAALLCLVNRERTAHGLPALREDRMLRGAARAQGADMVRRRYFGHVTPGGLTLQGRLVRRGWLGSVAGENIAWGAGPPATPAGIVRAWMHSPEHRANLLDPAFRRAGAAVRAGAPIAAVTAGAVTYAMEYDAP